jgi:glycosyltransferase involved in cell wall biosynthesis
LKDSPAISVIIPTLNEEKLIVQTARQFTPLLKEKYKIELIISDGGSIDRTLDLCKQFADIIASAQPGEKQNIPQGRNAGAKLANGKLLCFFNADTLINDIDTFFKVTVSAFNDPEVLAATCRIRVFPEEEILMDRLFHSFYNSYVRSLNALGMGMGRGECHIVRQDVFNSANGYNENLSAGEDYDLFRRIRKLGKIKFMKKLVVYESPRRYRKFGYRKVIGDWTKNSLSVLFKNKSSSKVWEAVR